MDLIARFERYFFKYFYFFFIDMIYEVVRFSGNVMFNFDSESILEGRRMIKFD